MITSVQILFNDPSEEDWRAMRTMANRLTDDRDSILVTADPHAPGWLHAEFTMPTETQIEAVDKIDRVLRYTVENRVDSCIGFPRSAAEIERARRKNERCKALRRARRIDRAS